MQAHPSCTQIWEEFEKFYERSEELDERRSKSLLFNAFIFMQLFNELNARKIADEYNIFEGLFSSPIFFGVIATTTLLQIIIVQTPVSTIFKITPLNGVEWAVSLAFGFVSFPLSMATRFISRNVFGCNLPRKGQDVAEMDLGYGTKVIEAVPSGSSPMIASKEV